jgi:hypothetical protein
MLAHQPGVKIEGPPPGLASGRYDVPRPAIVAVAVVIVVIGLGYTLVRLVRRQKPR